MKACQAVISFVLVNSFCSVSGVTVSDISCGNICSAVPGSPYTLTCTWSGSLTTGIVWHRDTGLIMTCDVPGTTCFPDIYSTGNYPNSTAAILTIAAFDSSTDSGMWECRDGTDPSLKCTLPVIATGNLEGQCTKNGKNYNISCSGIVSHGSPAATLELKVGSTVLESTTSTGSVSSTQTDAAGKIYTCEVTGIAATCLSPISVPVTCTDTSTQPSNGTTDCLCQCSCDCKETSTIVLIITIVLLVISITVFIAFIIIFCVCNIKKYDEQYHIAVFIGAIVVCIGAIACTIAVFVLASTVEKPQDDGEECCCSTCEPDGMEMKDKCVGLKISAAFFSILDAVLMLIIIIIILIVWCCPGKCGTAKLLMCCNSPPAEASPTVRSNSNGGGTPSNTVKPRQAKPKSAVEK